MIIQWLFHDHFHSPPSCVTARVSMTFPFRAKKNFGEKESLI